MILYDLLIHIVWLLKIEDFFLKRKLNFWPNFGKGKKYNRNLYQTFWTIYWGVALLLAVILILNN